MKTPNLLLQTCIVFLWLVIISLSSCVKDESNCIAKKSNGGINVIVYPIYNGKPVISRSAHKNIAYVKYGTSSFPGNSLGKYEVKVVAPAGDHFVNISKLNCGAYYFYVTCQDSATGLPLTGGASLITDKVVGDFDIVIPVTPQ